MTNTQDLSLLTDDERAKRKETRLLYNEYSTSREYSDMLEAALVAARAENKRLREALNSLRKEHLIVEDCWYSCPKSGDEYCGKNKGGECDCGADRHNAIIDAALLQSEKGGE